MDLLCETGVKTPGGLSGKRQIFMQTSNIHANAKYSGKGTISILTNLTKVKSSLIKCFHNKLRSNSTMSSETNSAAQSTTGADAIDVAIASGIDFDGTPIPKAKLDLYEQVMGLEAGRQRSGVSNTMRSRIVRIGVKHLPQNELDQMLVAADFAPLKDKEVAFYYGGK